MEWAKLSGNRLYADYEFLYGRHPQYLQSPKEVRAAVELVLSMPERVQALAKNMSFVGSDQETGKIYRIEINQHPKRKANHIRSVFEITPEQYEKIKLEEPPVLQLSPTKDINHAAARTISSFMHNQITDSDEKSSCNIKFSVATLMNSEAFDVASIAIPDPLKAFSFMSYTTTRIVNMNSQQSKAELDFLLKGLKKQLQQYSKLAEYMKKDDQIPEMQKKFNEFMEAYNQAVQKVKQ